jgi:hypothetical protein
MTADTTPAGATPVAGGATPPQSTPEPTGQSQAPAGGQPATGANGQDGAATLGDAGKRALEAERQAAKDWKAKAEANQRELEALRQAQMSDSEKRDARLADLERAQADWERERQDLVLERTVERQASKLGFADPADALGLLDRNALEFEADGNPRNVEAQLQALAKAKPYLLARTTTSAGSWDAGTGGQTSASGSRIYTRQELRDPKFYADNQADIERALREGRIRNS